MACNVKRGSNAVCNLNDIVVLCLSKQAGRGFHIFGRVKRLRRVRACSTLLFVAPLFEVCILLLNFCRIEHYNTGNIPGCRGAPNRAAETGPNQFGQKSTMIEVSMGEEHRINRFGIEGKRIKITVFIITFLVKAAVNQDSRRRPFNKIAGPCYILCCAVKTKSNSHTVPPAFRKMRFVYMLYGCRRHPVRGRQTDEI